MKAFAILLLLSQTIWACQICLPYPQQSLLDRVNAAEHIVLSRENPQKPYYLSAVEVLRGSDAGFGLFLPSATRRELAVYPERSILAGFMDGEWQQMGVYRPSMRPLLDTMLHNDWGEDASKRASYFVQFLSHADDDIRKLAHLEVAKAPYSQIRKLEHSLDKHVLISFLEDQRMVEWHSLYILLLAQMASEDDFANIAERVQMLGAYHINTQLAAWALAYLETGGESAIDFLEKNYVIDVSRTYEERSAVAVALASYAGVLDDRERFIGMLTAMLESDAELLGTLLPWFEVWEANEAAPAVLASVSENTDIQLRGQANQFVMQAKEPVVAEERQVGWKTVAIFGLLLMAVVSLAVLSRSRD